METREAVAWNRQPRTPDARTQTRCGRPSRARCCAVAPGEGPSFGKEDSLPHARQDRQASLGSADLWRADRDQKSPVRRCFKSRPPLGGVRRFASGCRPYRGRLTGLLSRSPPADTRPQARAYWARRKLGESQAIASGFFASPAFRGRLWRRGPSTHLRAPAAPDNVRTKRCKSCG